MRSKQKFKRLFEDPDIEIKKQNKNIWRIRGVLSLFEKRVTGYVIVLFLVLTSFNTNSLIAQNSEIGNQDLGSYIKQSKWSYTFQVGWATNIDFTVGSTSQDYRFDDRSTGLDAKFYSYDSRKKISQMEGDQANNYLLTIKNQSSGFTVTTGIIHDKREQRKNKEGMRFKYEKGGMSPVLLFGTQYDLTSDILRNISFQVKVGGFLNFNKIDAFLVNKDRRLLYSTGNTHRTYAGGGGVAMVVVSYQYYISNAVSISLLINGNMMAGNAITKATEYN